MVADAPNVGPVQALIFAINAHDAPRVRHLLEHHRELRDLINRGSDELGFGSTPLVAAVQQGNIDMIDALLTAGADITVKSDWWAGGFSVLENAAEDLVPFLLERGAVLEPCSAAKFGMVNRLAQMVAQDSDAVHTRGGDGKTPLHWARDLATARFLVEHGADIDARDVDHESTAVQYMVRDRPDVARYLVATGASADIFAAAALGDLALARRILDADPAAVEGAIDRVSFPMQDPRAGGPIYIWTLGGGKTPHMVAQEFGHTDVYDLLMERSSDALKLAQACVLGDKALFEQFLAAHPELRAEIVPAIRQRVLDAAINNNARAVQLMLRAGWPVDAEAPQGGTLLHWAAWHGNAEMVREVLRFNPPLDARDSAHDGTALDWALHGSVNGWHVKDGDFGAVVTALLDAGISHDHPLPTLIGSEAAVAACRSYAQRPRDSASSGE